MPERWNDQTGADRYASANCSSITRAFYLPATDVNCVVTVIIELDELITGSARTARAKFTDDD